jgi:uracil-DNA glycosylase
MNIVNKNKFIKQHIELYGNEFFFDSPSHHSIKSDLLNNSALTIFESSVVDCMKCELGTSRKKIVFGSGDKNADLLIVGEAPNEYEDEKGRPFVGKAGKLLDKILNAIGLSRTENVYLTNVLKCKTPSNRDPLLSEVNNCNSYLLKQIEIIKPKIIVALGKVAGKSLLNKDLSLKKLRSQFYEFNSIPLKVTYHPQSLLNEPALKKNAWEDFQAVRDFINQF